MTFSLRCKEDIIANMAQKPCCRSAHLYGMICFAKRFSKDEIRFTSESDFIIEHYLSLLESCGVPSAAAVLSAGLREKTAAITDRDVIEHILCDFSYLGDETSFRLLQENFVCEDCVRSFLAGCFIAGGTVTDPRINYHLEFTSHKQLFFRDFFELVCELGLEPKLSSRGYSKLLYFKDSSRIEDILALMGAYNCSMELMNTKIEKDIRNNVNRAINCESANIGKTVDASATLAADIQLIAEREVALDPQLATIAQLRLDNRELSLSELGQLCEPKMTKSGVHHRLSRLHQIAEDLRKSAYERD